MSKKNWPNRILAWCLALGAGLLVALLFWLGLFNSWQGKLSDKLFLGHAPSPEIAIIAIDNSSLKAIGRWPWLRSVHARLLDILSTAQPKIIGLDVAFPEASPDDAQLAVALKRAPVVLAAEAEGLHWVKGNLTAEKMLLPVGPLGASAEAGVTNLPPDSDGVVRRAPQAIKTAGGEYQAFFFRLSPGVSPASVTINFAGPPGTFETFSYNDVLTGKVLPETFENKIVLIGATAPDLHDEQLVPTSNGRLMSGVEIHANIIQTILTRNFLREVPAWVTILSIIFLALFCGLVFEYLKAVKALFTAIALAVLYLITALIWFDYGWILNLLFPLATIFLVYVIILLTQYLGEEKAKRRLRKIFSQYVSPAVVEEVLALDELKLGGVQKNLTVFFSDIRGFTSISEKLTPEELVHVLNEYLTAMTDLVFKHRGVVDKYMGDAIMAFWGAPLPDADHAYHTCVCAIEMVTKLQELQKHFGVHNLPVFNIGIGINTGEMVVGNMGSHERFDYTVMGDNVNLGSRLEGLNKEYGSGIIFSQFTLAELIKTGQEKNLVYRFLDRVAVKGKNEPVEIYELLGLNTDTRLTDLVDKYQRAIGIFQQNNFLEAKRLFGEVLQKYPADGPALYYINRIDKIFSGEIKDWDGVNRMKTK